MSSAQSLPVKRITPPNLDFEAQKFYGLVSGASDITYYNYASTSYNDSSINITVNPPANSMAMDRALFLTASISLTFTGTPQLNAYLIQPQYDAPRFLPLMSCVNNMTVTINNDSFSVQANEFLSAVTRLYDIKDFNYGQSATSQYDNYQQYGEWRDPFQGDAKNALSGYGNGSTFGGRGAFVEIVSNPVGDGVNVRTATARLNICEPIGVVLAPFLADTSQNQKEKMLYGLNQLTLNLSLGNLARCWSHDPSSPVANWNLTATLSQFAVPAPSFAPTLLANFTTISALSGSGMPLSNSWPYMEPQILPVSSGQTIAPGASAVINMNSVNLKAVPNMLLVYARESTAQQQAAGGNTFSDTFAVIENLTIQFNNKSGILANASKQQLHAISLKNGVKLNYQDWSKYVGSVVCLKFGEDIPLSPEYAPGVNGSFNLAVQATISRPAMLPGVSPPLVVQNKTYTLYVIPFFEGVLMLNGSAFSHSTGFLNVNDVLTAPEATDEDAFKKNEQNGLYGGSWWSDVKRGISKGLDIINPVMSVLPGQYKQLYDAGRSVTGLGLVTGGEMMTKNNIMKRVKKLQKQL